MADFFYKYTSLHKDFFENLMLRATPFVALNDPYEGHMNFKQFKNANSGLDAYYSKHGHIADKLSDNDLEGVMGVLQSDLNDVGVFSFSEDYSNPLMWAHYAENHRGIVIEFDSSKTLFQDSIKCIGRRGCRFDKVSLGDIYEFPEKVMYRREMPIFDRPEQVRPKSDKEYHWIKFLYNMFFTKSNDWIYEKELRSIVRLCDADSLICENDNLIEGVLAKHPEVKKVPLRNGKIQITYPNEYEMHEDVGDESIKNEIYMLSLFYNSSNIHLFRINPEAISGIYCGCKCNYEEVKELVGKNELLKHLKKGIYKMEIDPYQYQLNKMPISI